MITDGELDHLDYILEDSEIIIIAKQLGITQDTVLRPEQDKSYEWRILKQLKLRKLKVT